MSQVILALRWYLVVQVFGFAALPLGLRLFRHLPDRGYGVSRPLGLLLAGWIFWLLTTFGWTHNTVGGILVALALLVAAGLAIHLSTNQPTNRPTDQPTNQPTNQPINQPTNQPINQPTNQLTNHLPRHIIIAVEIVFGVAFAAWCVVRAYMPRIETAGGEKWMEIAFLNAVLRSETFPPHDPWLSGFAISYYYFGYVIMAMLTRLAAVPSPIAFNLGIATLFALTCTGAFSLVYNLIAVDGVLFDWRSRKTMAIAGGLLAILLVAVMGNLQGLLEMLHARGIGPAAFWAWLDIRHINEAPVPFAEGSWMPRRFFWWWQAARVLQDYTPWGERVEVIDEFPSFSFILGDMHPHVLGLPFVLLALALALNLYLRISASVHRRMPNHESRISNLRSTICDLRLWEFLIYATCLGGLGFLNTWDFPIYLFVVSAAYTLASLRLTSYALRFAFLFLSLLIVGVLLYLPFWVSFQSQAGGILPNLFNGTRLPHFWVMFGPLVFIAAAFVVSRLRQERIWGSTVVKWIAIVWVGIVGTLALILGFVVLLILAGVLPLQGPAAYLVACLRNEPIPGLPGVSGTLIGRGLMSRFIAPTILDPRPFLAYVGVLIGAIVGAPLWVTVGLIALIVSAALIFLRTRVASPDLPAAGNSPPAVRDFVLLLFATGALLALSVEYVFLRDVYNSRMNTVFKFYFQTWILWGVAGAYALVDIVRRRGRILLVFVALLILAGLVYPVLAIPTRAREYGGPPTLDGTAYLAYVQPDDYAAIAWLNEHVDGAPVILEAPGSNYSSWVYEGRVSAHTGLPTLLGWGGHENQWRGSYDEPARREPDIERLYAGTDPAETLTLLKKYDIQYVYVGPLERNRYPADGLAKFPVLMDVVYNTGAVTIYRYRLPSDARP